MANNLNNSFLNDFEPSEFFLSQNYPNPFKDSTKIKYCVANRTRVLITVFNSENEEVEKLVDEIKDPGTYEVEFKSSSCHSGESADGGRNLPAGRQGLADGYYFYQMTADEFISDKKWFCINKLLRSNTMKTLLHTLFFFLLVSQICFGQWVQVGLNSEVIKDIAVQNQNIFVVTADSCDIGCSIFDPLLGKLYRSNDNGLNWTMLVDSNVVDVAISTSGKIFKIEKDSVYGFGKSANLYYSLDNGNNWFWTDIEWQLIDSLLYPEEPEKIYISPDGTIFCNIIDSYSDYEPPFDSECMEWAKWRDIIAKSTDDGVTWLTPGKSVIGGANFSIKNNLGLTFGENHRPWFAGGYQSYFHITSDYGNTWNYSGNPPMILTRTLELFTNGNIIISYGEAPGAEFNGSFISTDMCSTWTQISSLNIQVGISYSSGSSEGMLVGTDSLGVFLFSDEGDSLGSKNEGLTNLNIQTLTLDNNGYVYAGTENGVWRRPLSEIVTSVEDEISQPTEFILEQNYPNPFNPSTTIKYSIPEISKVKLTLFNLLGEEVTTLLNEEKVAGNYSIEFNASSLPSGVYFYQLRADEFVNTKKMILLK